MGEELHLHPCLVLCHTLLHIKPIYQVSVNLNRTSLLLRAALLMLKLCFSFLKCSVIECQQKLLTWQ